MDVGNIAVADRLDVEFERKNDAQVITTAMPLCSLRFGNSK